MGAKNKEICALKPMGARVQAVFNTFRLGGNMVQYKVDWLAFSIKFASEDIDPFSLDLFEELGYDLGEFEETPKAIFLQFWLDVLPIRKCVLE